MMGPYSGALWASSTWKMCSLHTQPTYVVASTDIDKYLSSSSASRSVYWSPFAKSAALGNKASRSMVTVDQVVKGLRKGK